MLSTGLGRQMADNLMGRRIRNEVWQSFTLFVLSLYAAAVSMPSQEPVTRRDIMLHQLPGRPLRVNEGKNIGFERDEATDNNQIRSRISRQYLVRVEYSARSNVRAELAKYSSYVRYFPYDSYVVIVKWGDLHAIRNLIGVMDVLEVPMALKVASPVLSTQKVSHQVRHEKIKCKSTSLSVLLAHKLQVDEVASICDLADTSKSVCRSAELVSEKKLIIATDSCSQGKIVSRLGQHPSVLWIEKKGKVSLRNKYARKIVQSEYGRSELLWSKGLLGDGEVIGITDTGVDIKSCFFNDTKVPVPTCMSTGAAYEQDCVNFKHRKIVTYVSNTFVFKCDPTDDSIIDQRYFNDTNIGDVFEGHGTHVCGSALGSALGACANSVAPDFDGIAKNAKLAFDDISVNGKDLMLPDDLNEGLFPHSYYAGARTQSLSWGSNETWYDSMAMEVDQFMYEHDDYLVVVAAGNDGPSFYTVGTPATAKNILSVGASFNSVAALTEYGDLTPSLKIIKGPFATAGSQYLVEPAAFGALVRVGSSSWYGLLSNAYPADACTTVSEGEVSGRIAVIDRGGCEFGIKAWNAQRAGATAAIVVNNVLNGALLKMGPGSAGQSVTIPAIFISKEDGVLLRNYMAAGPVNITFPEDFVELLPGEGRETMNRLADFSSRGPTFDQRIKPDVICPGAHIFSVLSGAPPTCDNQSLLEMSGTSMATPNCAGSAALVRQYFREGFHVNGYQNSSCSLNATSALVKAMIIHSGRSIFNMESNNPTMLPSTLPDVSQGYGRVELSSVLFFGAESGFNLSVWNNESIAHGTTIHYCAQVHSGQGPLRISLVWTDPPGTPGSSKILINDLDLIVVGPDGSFFWGNSQTQWNEAHGAHPAFDEANNCEQVTIAAPREGLYVVHVRGSDVPVEPQRYSMVVTGQFLTASECNQMLRCPSNCSGHGSCIDGACACAIQYSGMDCSLLRVVLRASEEYSLAVSSEGWAYYLLDIPAQVSSWQLTLDVEYGDPDFYVAFNRTPSWSDYNLGDNGWWSHIELRCNTSCTSRWGGSEASSGTWVLGVNSQCCNTSRAVATLAVDLVAVECLAGFYTLNGGECRACTTSPCPVGQYRSICTPSADAACMPCSWKPKGASFTSGGVPYDHDNCSWSCDTGLYWDGIVCTNHLNPVQLPSTTSPGPQSTAGIFSVVEFGPSTSSTVEKALVFIIGLPMTYAAFTAQQTQFIAAVAATTMCKLEQVHVLSVQAYNESGSAAGRRLLAEAVKVQTEIDVVDSDLLSGPGSATAMAGLLTASGNLDKNLRSVGLPESLGITILSSSSLTHQTTPAPPSSSSESSTPVAMAVGLAVGGAALLALVVLAAFCLRPRQQASADTVAGGRAAVSCDLGPQRNHTLAGASTIESVSAAAASFGGNFAYESRVAGATSVTVGVVVVKDDTLWAESRPPQGVQS